MLLFAFRSRTQSMKIYDTFRARGCACSIINTPREVSASCGLSVTVPETDAERAIRIYDYYKPDTLIGIFRCDANGCTRYR
ncbi:MAG: DUF3343 domain-containing protein [Clostridiales bacterium]|nr:DUF3343 domain-containing protein [Clostridiales bacterium]